MVVKRDGTRVVFDRSRIEDAVYKTFCAVAQHNETSSRQYAETVTEDVTNNLPSLDRDVAVEDIQDAVEQAMMRQGHHKEARAYIVYREQRSTSRDFKRMFVQVDQLAANYLGEADWRVKENANTSFSLQGLNNYFADALTARYWLLLLPEEAAVAHTEGIMHIHDLGIFAPYCCGWDLQQLLSEGFGGVPGKLNCKPPKHFGAALGQIVNFFYTLQGENAGAQAFSNFDTLMAPYVREDELSYEQVKQGIQEFVFNCNVPTRVGFQCLAESTEILTVDGWRTHDKVHVGDRIATFNLDKNCIEYLPVKKMFARHYEGKMYNLTNRSNDQLISPGHRVVWKPFNRDSWELRPVEELLQYKTPITIPLSTEGNVGGNDFLKEDWVMLAAWIAADGSWDKHGRGVGRITIYQSNYANPEKCQEIEGILTRLGLEWSEREQRGLGAPCRVYRLSAKASRKVAHYFNTDKHAGMKFVPEQLLTANTRLSRLFIETYLKADGTQGRVITTVHPELRDGIMAVAANAGYGTTCHVVRVREDSLMRREQYQIRLRQSKETAVNITEVQYDGVIWCPNTDNETVIARRNGKVFITGNTPFTNLTLDVTVPATFADEYATIAGKPLAYKYSELQAEMDMLNRALAEVLVDGDASGRPFTFPIPTYNIWGGTDYEHERWDPIWQMAAETGLPYFANFVNSDMRPEDVRSMCCRLRLNHNDMKRRLGGLFGSTPLTGSVGVVTINLARAALMAGSDINVYLENLRQAVALAESALVARRKIVDDMTRAGLYPYSRHYLRGVKEKNGGYWSQHFLTIGLCGAHEAAMELFGKGIESPEGYELASATLDFLREQVDALNAKYEPEHYMFNLEATPAEGASFRLAKADAERYPASYAAQSAGMPYTGSTLQPVDSELSLFDALTFQAELQTKYTGGTVFHAYMGQPLTSPDQARHLVAYMCSNFRLPYITLSPVYSICPTHGRMPGERPTCPTCGNDCEVWSRIVGYYRPVSQWSAGKQKEHEARVYYEPEGVLT